jgi:hypothetical protein
MIFASEKARKQLLEKGFVWTFRTHRRKLQVQGGPVPRRVSFDWATDHRCGKKLCDVRIQNEHEVANSADLESYIGGSGFDDIHEWINEIRRLNPKLGTEVKGWLYLVCRC